MISKFMPSARGGLDKSWADDGLCAGVDPDLFHPERGGDVATPKAICRQCPVQEACLEYAVAAKEPFGIWGGMSRRERERLSRARRVAS